MIRGEHGCGPVVGEGAPLFTRTVRRAGGERRARGGVGSPLTLCCRPSNAFPYSLEGLPCGCRLPLQAAFQKATWAISTAHDKSSPGTPIGAVLGPGGPLLTDWSLAQDFSLGICRSKARAKAVE
jgi:hypothetical protein